MEERERAIALVEEIAGDAAEMSEPTVLMLQRLRDALGLPRRSAPAALVAAPAPLALEAAQVPFVSEAQR